MAVAEIIAEKRRQMDQAIARLEMLRQGFLGQAALQLGIWMEELAKDIFINHIEISEGLSDPHLLELRRQVHDLKRSSTEMIEGLFGDKRYWWHLEPQRDPADVGLINLYTEQGPRLGPKRFHEGFETLLARHLIDVFEPAGYPVSASPNWAQDGTPRYRGQLLWPPDLVMVLGDYDNIFQTEVKRIYRDLAQLEVQWRKHELEQRWDRMEVAETIPESAEDLEEEQPRPEWDPVPVTPA